MQSIMSDSYGSILTLGQKDHYRGEIMPRVLFKSLVFFLNNNLNNIKVLQIRGTGSTY